MSRASFVVRPLGDFIPERASREFFGGLPTGEYVLHIILAMLFGALVASVFFSVGLWGAMPTRLTYEPAAVPIFLRVVMGFMAIFVLFTGAMDAAAATRLSKVANHE